MVVWPCPQGHSSCSVGGGAFQPGSFTCLTHPECPQATAWIYSYPNTEHLGQSPPFLLPHPSIHMLTV